MLSKQEEEHWTLEGLVLRGIAISLVLSLTWMAVRPLIYRILPEFGASLHGPTAFPVTVHIGQDAIAVTNGSTEHWTCKMDLGFNEEHVKAIAKIAGRGGRATGLIAELTSRARSRSGELRG